MDKYWQFDGHIVGVGTTSGTRVVIGAWHDSDLGAFTDVMVARPDGRRILLAPNGEVARFVSATYTFDEIRVEPVQASIDGDLWRVSSRSLDMEISILGRTRLGTLLSLVPAVIAKSRWFTVLSDPIARLLVNGVRTKSVSSRKGQWYGATDNRRIGAVAGHFDGDQLGELAPLSPDPAFGFSSTPELPSLTALRSTVGTTTATYAVRVPVQRKAEVPVAAWPITS